MIVIKLANQQELIPVIWVLVCKIPEISLELLVDSLSLAVSLWMVSH
jgi:hypothetical protein